MIASRRGALAALAVAVAAIVVAITCPARAIRIDRPRSGLRTIEARSGPIPFVLLHGYGSSAEEWVPFTFTIRLPAGYRFVLPEAPETTSPPDGPANGRAWWHLGLDRYRRSVDQLPDLSQTNPPELAASNRRVRLLLDELARAGGYSRERQILAGFSQGAMIAADIAFTSDERLDALVLMSPTIVNERVWLEGMPRRKGLRVFVSHGRRDDILPFDVADRLQRAMHEAGLRVTWVPFDGGHEMPMAVVDRLNGFLAGRDDP